MNTTAIRPLIKASDIRIEVNNIATQIIRDYKYKNPMIIGVLKGASRFMMDLVRALSFVSGFEFDYDFIAVESYRETIRTNDLKLVMGIGSPQVVDRHVILIDDIYDTGVTLRWLTDYLVSKWPLTINHCVLLNKNCTKVHKHDIRYTGFTVEDHFVVGYGMDHNGKYRSLPFIGELDDENS